MFSLRLFSGKYSEALANYERGLAATSSDDHVKLCQFGIARTNIKIGDYKKGVSNSPLISLNFRLKWFNFPFIFRSNWQWNWTTSNCCTIVPKHWLVLGIRPKRRIYMKWPKAGTRLASYSCSWRHGKRSIRFCRMWPVPRCMRSTRRPAKPTASTTKR